MHTFVKYLVRISDAAEAENFDRNDREEAMDALCSYVDAETEEYQDTAYDYRTFYEGGVIFAADDPDAFANILQSVQAWQKTEMEETLNRIAECCGTTDLAQIVRQNGEPVGVGLSSYYIQRIGDILTDQFTADSIFFDIEAASPSVTQKTFDKVMSCPEDWAIVVANQHI